MTDNRNDAVNVGEGHSPEEMQPDTQGQSAVEADEIVIAPASTSTPDVHSADPTPADTAESMSDESPASGTDSPARVETGAEDIAVDAIPTADPPVLRPATEAQQTLDEAVPQAAIGSPSAGMPAGQGFVWHPVYAGRTYADVLATLTEDISRDQRTYELAMAGAEGSEHDALKSVVDLERRWSPYDFDWVEADPSELAGRILAFEQDREQRQEMRPFADYRTSGALHQPSPAQPPEPTRSLPIVPIGVGVLVLLILVFILFAVR